MNQSEDKNELLNILGNPEEIEVDSLVMDQARQVAMAAFGEATNKRKLQWQRNLMFALVLLLTGFIGGMLVKRSPASGPNFAGALPMTDASALLANGQDLFGDKVEAVVVSDGDIKWFLGSQKNPSNSPYYLVHFVDPQTNQPVSVITTSGGKFAIGKNQGVEVFKGVDERFFVSGDNYVLESESVEVEPMVLY